MKIVLTRFDVFALPSSSVLVSRYQSYNVQVNDAYVTINNTAILQCSVNPYYLQTYVVVTSWVQNGRTIATG